MLEKPYPVVTEFVVIGLWRGGCYIVEANGG